MSMPPKAYDCFWRCANSQKGHACCQGHEDGSCKRPGALRGKSALGSSGTLQFHNLAPYIPFIHGSFQALSVFCGMRAIFRNEGLLGMGWNDSVTSFGSLRMRWTKIACPNWGVPGQLKAWWSTGSHRNSARMHHDHGNVRWDYCIVTNVIIVVLIIMMRVIPMVGCICCDCDVGNAHHAQWSLRLALALLITSTY